ncbi:hypothetical protein [Sphingomonas parapaucimobilis]|nr:hypothetical protein [Sphingomonas parapaucimobilis]
MMTPTNLPVIPGGTNTETKEQRARRLFDRIARSIGREAVNHLKTMYPDHLTERAHSSKSWETSLTNSVRNDINWHMRPLLMALIAMHREWDEEATGGEEPVKT